MRRTAFRLRSRARAVRIEPWQRTLYTVIIAETIAIAGFSISNPFLPFFIQELGVTELNQVAFWVGLISSTAPITMAVASPIWGLVADRYGRKPMLVRAMLGGSVMIGLNAFVVNVPQLAALRIIQGALTGTVAAATTLVATSVPRERCGYALGLLQTAIFSAHFLGPSVGGYIGGAYGFRAAFLCSGVLLFVAGLLVIWLVHEEFVPPPPGRRDGNALAANARSILGEPMLLAMVALLMLNQFSGSITSPVLPLYVQTLVANAQEASKATGLILGATAGANAVAAVLIGRSADRLGRHRVLLTCVGVAALVYFPQMLTKHPTQLLLLRVVLGFAMGAVGPIANALIAERSPEGHQGGIYGISTSLNALAMALGPMLGTLVVTSWGLGSVFAVTGTLLAVAAGWVAVRMRELDAPAPGVPVAPAVRPRPVVSSGHGPQPEA